MSDTKTNYRNLKKNEEESIVLLFFDLLIWTKMNSFMLNIICLILIGMRDKSIDGCTYCYKFMRAINLDFSRTWWHFFSNMWKYFCGIILEMWCGVVQEISKKPRILFLPQQKLMSIPQEYRTDGVVLLKPMHMATLLRFRNYLEQCSPQNVLVFIIIFFLCERSDIIFEISQYLSF